MLKSLEEREKEAYDECVRRYQEEVARAKEKAAEETEEAEELEANRVASEKRPPWQSTRRPDPPLASDITAELDSLGVEAENKRAGPAGSGPAVRSSDRDEVKLQYKTTTINSAISQEKSLLTGKIIKWGVEITARRPAYSINEKIGIAYIDSLKRELTLNECNLLGLLNSLMTRYGYAFASYEQLAHWLTMKPEGIRTMVRRLKKAGLVTDVSQIHGKHRWVVCPELQNPKKKKSGDAPF